MCCVAHARRKFVTASEAGDERASKALELIGKLYVIERALPPLLSPSDDPVQRELRRQREEQRRQLRQRDAEPVWDELSKWLGEQKPGVLPKSPLGTAIGYASNNWDALKRYLEQGFLAIGRVEEWRGAIVLLDPNMAGLNTDTMSQLHPTPVSTPRSSNRTCRFPASGSHPDHQTFAFGVAARWSGTGKSPSSSYR